MFWVEIGVVCLSGLAFLVAYRRRNYLIMDMITIFLLLFSSVLVLAGCYPSTARAERRGYSSSDKLWLGRSLWAEAGPKVNRDHAIIPFVYARRWPAVEKYRKQCVLYEAVVRAYSRPMRSCRYASRTARRCRIRRTPWGRLPEGVRKIAEKFVRGLLPNVCPRAGHFGSVADGNPFRFRRVFCGRTFNRFYR